MIKLINFFVLIISIFICVLLIEITLRVKGVGSNNILYYSSNYYGYYQIPDQKITRRGNLISLDKYGNEIQKNTLENSSLIFWVTQLHMGSVVSNNETFLIWLQINEPQLFKYFFKWMGYSNIINF